MSKKKLRLTDPTGQELTNVPSIKSIRPSGVQVMVELLTPQEATGLKKIHISEDTDIGAPQAYILGVGPMVPESYGLEKGQRVVLTANFNPVTFTPVPNGWNESGREVVCTEPSSIKAIIEE